MECYTMESNMLPDVDVIVTILRSRCVPENFPIPPSCQSENDDNNQKLQRVSETAACIQPHSGNGKAKVSFGLGEKGPQSPKRADAQIEGRNSVSSNERLNTGESERTCACLIHTVSIDPMLASCLTAELQRSTAFKFNFRQSLVNSVLEMDKDDQVKTFSSFRAKTYLQLRLKLSTTTKYFKMEPDIRWSHRMLPQWIQRIHMEEAFSWLSTLGGAYSSLGDNLYNCALEAGQVAMRQLYLAECLGDPVLRSRCLLYVALSMMQTGRLSCAKHLVRQQYTFATSKPDCVDARLVSMCHGIWHHLRHYYAKRREN